jgi:hypothetical protein
VLSDGGVVADSTQLTRMPRLSLDFLELYSKQFLVDLKDSRDNNRDWEVLFHEHIIQVQGGFDEFAVVIAVIPEVKLSVEREPTLLMLLFLQGEEDLAFFYTDRSQLLFKIIKELWLTSQNA